jgi:hypothetical protein
MSALDLSAVMDAIADTIRTANVTERVYEWPTESVTEPCAVVGYPRDEEIDFDVTYGRGSDRAVFPVYLLVGKVSDRTARDRLSALLTGATGLKDHVDGTLGGVVQTARLITVGIEEITVGAVKYLAAVAKIEVYT